MPFTRENRQGFPLRWTDNVWLLGINEFPYYFIAGNKYCAVSDCGASGMVPLVLQHLEQINPGLPLKFLIVSHAHTDHITGLMKLKQIKPETLLTASSQSAEVLSKEKVIAHFVYEDLLYSDILLKNGLIEEVPEMLPAESVQTDHIIGHNDLIDLGGVELQIVDAPGHAPGNTAILIKPDNVLLVSDAAGYAESIDTVFPLFFHNFNTSIDSLDLFKSYRPDHIGLGHNLRIDGAEACLHFLDEVKNKFFDMKNEIIDLLKSGSSPDEVENVFAERLHKYELFSYFDHKILKGFMAIIVKRALE